MKFRYGAPVSLTFFFLSMFVLYLENRIYESSIIQNVFTVRGSGNFNFRNFHDYFKLFLYILGHKNWDHLIDNFMFILLLGPALEERVGSFKFFFMVLFTAFLGGIVNVLFFSTSLIGCSGIAFMMIVFSSFTSIKKRGEIPISLFLVMVLYFWKELAGLFTEKNASQTAHIVGGFCGGVYGFTEFAVLKKKSTNTTNTS